MSYCLSAKIRVDNELFACFCLSSVEIKITYLITTTSFWKIWRHPNPETRPPQTHQIHFFGSDLGRGDVEHHQKMLMV